MAKEVTVFDAPKSMATIAKGFIDKAKNPQPTFDGKPILKMSKDSGEWFFGVENIEVEPDAQWAVNIASWQEGWRAWSEYGVGKSEILGEALVNIHDGEAVPALGSLPDVGQPYKYTYSVDMACVSGEDEGVEVTYSPTSQGGTDFFKKLGVDIGRRFQAKEKACIPVITLQHSNYVSKAFGPQTKPEYTIVGWVEAGKKKVKKTPPKTSKARTRKSA